MKRIVIALVLLLSGCASIPSSGPVRVGSPAPVRIPNDSVRVIARAPVAGMTPEQIAQGFLSANASANDGYAVARAYLTSAAAARWKPRQVAVYDPTQVDISVIDATDVRVTVGVIGELGSNGRLQLPDAIGSRSFDLTISQTASGNRIDSPPPMVLMTWADFQRNYESHPLWFLNADYARLVPDFVWVPRGDAAIPTRLTQLLLAGPAATMSQALRTALPADAKLAFGAVTILDGVAELKLTAAATQIQDSQRQAMLAQLAYTLRPVAAQFTVTAGGQPLRYGSRQLLSASQFDRFDPDGRQVTNPLFYGSAGWLWRVTPDGPSKLWQTAAASSLAVARNGIAVALAVGNRVDIRSVVDGTVIRSLAVSAQDLDFDPAGRLWIAGTDGSLQVLPDGGSLQTIAGLNQTSQIASVAVSPDGARIAVVAATGKGMQLRTYPLLFGAGGVSLGPASRWERSFADAMDADWISATELAVVARTGVESAQVFRLSLESLRPQSIPGLAGIERVVAAPGEPICAVDSNSRIWCWSGGEWQSGAKASAVAYAG